MVYLAGSPAVLWVNTAASPELGRRHANQKDPVVNLFSFLPDGEETGSIALSRGELDRRDRALGCDSSDLAWPDSGLCCFNPPDSN